MFFTHSQNPQKFQNPCSCSRAILFQAVAGLIVLSGVASPTLGVEVFSCSSFRDNMTPYCSDESPIPPVSIGCTGGSTDFVGSADAGISKNFIKARGWGFPHAFGYLITQMQVDDLVISSPGGGGGTVSASFNLDVQSSYLHETNVTPGSPSYSATGCLEISYNFVGYGSGWLGRWQPDAPNGGCTSPYGAFAGLGGTSISGTFTNPGVVTMPSDTPINFSINVRNFAHGASPGGGEFSFSTMDTFVTLPVAGPVFNLPKGYTANSVKMHIVDNQWHPELMCQEDIAPAGVGNGTVNIDDLVAVLNGFGPCPGGVTPCEADIAPLGGNGTVNIDDLVGVLNAFGACP